MRSWKVNGKYPVYNEAGTITATDITLQNTSGRFASFAERIAGDHTAKEDAELIKLALDSYFKSEYADKAMAESVQKVDTLEVAHKENEKAIASNKEIAEFASEIGKTVALAIITAGFVDPTIFKRLVDLLPQAKDGTTYKANDLFSVNDSTYKPKYGEGTRVLVQVNKDFTYEGQTVKQLEGDLSNNGILAVWKWTEPTENV